MGLWASPSLLRSHGLWVQPSLCVYPSFWAILSVWQSWWVFFDVSGSYPDTCMAVFDRAVYMWAVTGQAGI